MAKQRRIMKEFRISEISAVDSPAQKPARAAIMKRDEDASHDDEQNTDPGDAGVIEAVRDTGGDPVRTEESPMTDNTEKVAELEAQIATLKADNEALTKRAEKAEADLKAAEIEKNDATVVIDGETIRKSEVGEGAFKLFQKQQDKIELAEFAKRAETEIPYLPGEAAAKAEALRAVAKMAEGPRAAIEQMLKAGSEAIGKKTAPLGKDGEKPSFEKADDELDALAKAYAAEHKVSPARAMDEVLKTAEGKAIYARRNKAA